MVLDFVCDLPWVVAIVVVCIGGLFWRKIMNKYEKAIDAINALFSDMDVPRQDIRNMLNDLISEIEIMLDGLDVDEQHEAGDDE